MGASCSQRLTACLRDSAGHAMELEESMPLDKRDKVMTFADVVLLATATEATIVTVWNNVALAEVRASKLGPPMVARALAYRAYVYVRRLGAVRRDRRWYRPWRQPAPTCKRAHRRPQSESDQLCGV